MKKIRLLAGLLCLTAASAFSQTPWPIITQQARPWTRWWWMGSAVDRDNIRSLLKVYADAGLGGVEIVPIYGAKEYEDKYISYLSPGWLSMLDYTVEQASLLNMGVNISIGTGWPVGGPQVRTEDAAAKMLVKLDTATNQYTIETGRTKQKVKRAAPGGEGFTLDHFSSEAVNNYFSRFDSAFGAGSHGVHAFYNDSYEVYGANWTSRFFEEFKKRRGYDLQQVLADFLSPRPSEKTARIKSDYRETLSDLLLESFTEKLDSWAHQKKALSLNQAHGSPGNLLDLYAAVDIPETETFGSTFFPIPGLRIDSNNAKDVPDPIMLRFASSAAHAAGHPLTSCETFTWLTEHFRTSWSQCKPEVEQVFLAGINHVFFHGSTYSPEEASWPGWLFYASVDFVPANSLWPHLDGLTGYIARCQSILQSGMPDNELAVYWPVYDAWHNPEGMDMPFKVHNIDDWLKSSAFYKEVTRLGEAGYAADFVSDRMLTQASVKDGRLQMAPGGAAYRVLLIPACDKMPLPTLKKIIALAEAGATVIFQRLPQDVPGWNNLEERRRQFRELLNTASGKEGSRDKGKLLVSDIIQPVLEQEGVYGEALVKTGLRFIRRSYNGGKYYYLVNHTSSAIDRQIPLRCESPELLLMDPQSGAYGRTAGAVKGKETWVRVQLQPGEALIVRTGPAEFRLPRWEYTEPAGGAQTVNTPWKLHFTAGGPLLPEDKTLVSLMPWTATNDSLANNFSGTASYTTEFKLEGPLAQDYLLQLGAVCESTRVWINGSLAGTAWSIPFRLKVGKYLRKGKNTIRIEVANLMANRIRFMDRNGLSWKNYHEINFVNIDYKNFDASGWDVQPSGLKGPVTLQPLKVLY